MYSENQFVFTDKYRLWRHLIFWLADAFIFTFVFKAASVDTETQLVLSFFWTPLHMIYAYPVMYIFIPRFLLKGKTVQFILIILLWGMLGWFWNYVCREYMYFEFYELVTGKVMPEAGRNPWAPSSFLAMVIPVGIGSAFVLFKHWMRKQRDYLNAEKEKINAELELLKAQIHPHFLFNTLNNIYSFSLQNSSKTPGMILKLSSLLSYMLYDCKANEVLLEKEIGIMRNYIDLEKERYANKLEISINIEGDIKGRYISPLIFLPFLENAFKHGTSEQLEKPWLSMDLSVKQNMLRCKIVNSKNEYIAVNENGIGINNVKKRLAYLYPGKYDLKINDEGNFFVVSLLLELNMKEREPAHQLQKQKLAETIEA